MDGYNNRMERKVNVRSNRDNTVEIQKQTIIPQEKYCVRFTIKSLKSSEVWMIVHLNYAEPMCLQQQRVTQA